MLVPDAKAKRYRMLVTKSAKPSPTSQSSRQHISSPTSVANIDVALVIRVDVFVTRFMKVNLGGDEYDRMGT